MTHLPSLLSPPVSIPRQCKQGAVLWTVLQLNDSYDLEKHLDISQVREPSGTQWGPPLLQVPPLLVLPLWRKLLLQPEKSARAMEVPPGQKSQVQAQGMAQG